MLSYAKAKRADDNHKPEMTIALTDFEGFCGFRPVVQIIAFLQRVESFRQLVGDKAAEAFEASPDKAHLRELFTAFMTSSDVEKRAADLIQSAQNTPDVIGGTLSSLLVRLNKQFPGDIGLFCAFFLNYVTMKPGEAMFLRANEPHAYISGGREKLYLKFRLSI